MVLIFEIAGLAFYAGHKGPDAASYDFLQHLFDRHLLAIQVTVFRHDVADIRSPFRFQYVENVTGMVLTRRYRHGIAHVQVRKVGERADDIIASFRPCEYY
jgi:hypothetical protein